MSGGGLGDAYFKEWGEDFWGTAATSFLTTSSLCCARGWEKYPAQLQNPFSQSHGFLWANSSPPQKRCPWPAARLLQLHHSSSFTAPQSASPYHAGVPCDRILTPHGYLHHFRLMLCSKNQAGADLYGCLVLFYIPIAVKGAQQMLHRSNGKPVHFGASACRLDQQQWCCLDSRILLSVHIYSLDGATQLGHLLLLLGRQKSKAWLQAPSENQFNSEFRKKKETCKGICCSETMWGSMSSTWPEMLWSILQVAAISHHLQVPGEPFWATSLSDHHNHVYWCCQLPLALFTLNISKALCDTMGRKAARASPVLQRTSSDGR